MGTKQVLVMRKFKSLRTGKYCAQAAHASMASFLDARQAMFFDEDTRAADYTEEWLANSFTKITLYVDTEKELKDLQRQCDEAHIPNALITDNGTTEFNEPTVTALGIGPWLNEEINEITKDLKLF